MLKLKIKLGKNSQIFYIILVLIAITFLVIMPNIAITSFSEGLQIWATKVLPALLPFFVLTKLLSYTNFVSFIGKKLSPITQKIYGVSGDSGYIYIMSVISGYPVGAKLTADLYSNNTITRGQAIAITSFTSTSGPLFIIGTVATGLFFNHKLGLILLLAHLSGAIINGVFYKCKNDTKVFKFEKASPNNFLQESMSSSILSIMVVGGFIALFYMFLKLLIEINAFTPFTNMFELIGVNPNISNAILCGLIEVTTGCIYLSKCVLDIHLIAPILTFLISFGGLSIHAQAYCYLKSFDMPYSLFLLQKFTQAVISTIVVIPLSFIFF